MGTSAATNFQTPDPLGPVRAAQASDLANIKREVAALNLARIESYHSGFADWSISVLNGAIPNTNPPAVPMAYEVGLFNDPTSGPGSLGPYGNTIVQWAYPVIGSTPVCPPLPLPALQVVTLHKGLIGVQLPTAPGWFQCLHGDTTAGGETLPLTSADGITGLFRKVASPFGSNPATGEVAGWWVKVG